MWMEWDRKREINRGGGSKREQLVVLYSIIPRRQGPSIMLLILCFSIKITMLQGVNIFLISHPTIIHLKCQIGPELSLSFMHDIELIRGHCDIPNECVFLVVWIIVELAENGRRWLSGQNSGVLFVINKHCDPKDKVFFFISGTTRNFMSWQPHLYCSNGYYRIDLQMSYDLLCWGIPAFKNILEHCVGQQNRSAPACTTGCCTRDVWTLGCTRRKPGNLLAISLYRCTVWLYFEVNANVSMLTQLQWPGTTTAVCVTAVQCGRPISRSLLPSNASMDSSLPFPCREGSNHWIHWSLPCPESQCTLKTTTVDTRSITANEPVSMGFWITWTNNTFSGRSRASWCKRKVAISWWCLWEIPCRLDWPFQFMKATLW